MITFFSMWKHQAFQHRSVSLPKETSTPTNSYYWIFSSQLIHFDGITSSHVMDGATWSLFQKNVYHFSMLFACFVLWRYLLTYFWQLIYSLYARNCKWKKFMLFQREVGCKIKGKGKRRHLTTNQNMEHRVTPPQF